MSTLSAPKGLISRGERQRAIVSAIFFALFRRAELTDGDAASRKLCATLLTEQSTSYAAPSKGEQPDWAGFF